eukprot:TRINITY_DN5276_c0_g1_i1.p2 TRINITY_DN5276_c0_g1~~TRINITY_DN5276_c0_g1_i1.p2  ORF type:complete len:272 (-),score=94.75 TRINITY_DN5276_c0_g1_i1:90-905(-)
MPTRAARRLSLTGRALVGARSTVNMVSRAFSPAAAAAITVALLLGATLSGASPTIVTPRAVGVNLPQTVRRGLIALPGCHAETQRFVVDYMDKRCLPDSSTPKYVYDVAKDVLEVFLDVEKANCMTTAAQRTTLATDIAWLMTKDVCGAPYTSIPEYDAGAYTCHAMSGCSDILDQFEEDFVKHGCVPKGNPTLDKFAQSLLEVFKLIEKDNCCVVRAQKRRLATDMAVLGSYSTCGGFGGVSRFAAAPSAVGAGADGVTDAPTGRLAFAD